MRRKKRAVKVTLRTRMLNTGKESLYLDFYPPIIDPETKEASRRQSLNRYLYPLRNRNGEFIKDIKGNYKYSQADLETKRIAEIIRNNKQNELDKEDIYTEAEADMLKAKKRSEEDFILFFEDFAKDKKDSNRSSWNSSLKHLKVYTQKTEKKESIRFCDITLQWCEGFKNYLLNTSSNRSDNEKLANNTASAYFVKLKVALKTAHKYGNLPKNLNDDLKGIREIETRREHLTMKELVTLVETPCQNNILKRAALFSALTGLRHSDIRNLRWKEVVESNGNCTLKYTIQKTGVYQETPISNEAVELCGERDIPDSQVFEGLKYSAYENKKLAQWIGLAGIDRNITFHVGRHTAATIVFLANNVSLENVAKILGHSSTKMTQHYAKVLDSSIMRDMQQVEAKFG